ncbi:MAG: CRTAC1 family protein [Acidobacteria bacterium]|nr:MAG: CRTAC1 family protein [Acidobacteriota bacterium]
MRRSLIFIALLAPGAAPANVSYDPVRLELLDSSGVRFVIEPSRTDHRHQPETMISGIALFDYNNDGWLDIYLVNGATMPGLEKADPRFHNRLFKNRGDLSFQDVTEAAGVQGRGYTHGVIAGDYDNDGQSDLFVAGLRENILYRNLGNGTFEDRTLKAGLGPGDPEYGTLWSVAAAFIDYDKDGWLDLFVSNYCVWDPKTEPICGPAGAPDYCHPQHYRGLPNSLYHNNHDGTFTNVSRPSGIRQHIGKGMGIGPADFDGDGWVDLFVANDTEPAFLFQNQKNGTFKEIGFEAGVAYTYSGAAVSGMGVDAKDIDNDSRPDVFEAALTNETMPLFRNLGNNLFEEVTASSGIAAVIRAKTGWSNGIADLNNDGWKDLFVACGDVMHPEGSFRERAPMGNALFVNLKNGKFADASSSAGDRFAAAKAVHRGAAFGDLDNDGRIDVVVTALNGPTEVWHNQSPSSNHWLSIRTTGRKSSRDGMGAKIKVTTASGSQYGHVNTAVGYGCSSDPRVHFGLGKDQRASRVEITWPSGIVQTLENLKADQILTVTEPEK